jgi:F-type H+-transporting ATPase subunit delta
VSYEAIARRWARAVFELGKEAERLPDVSRDLASFAQVYRESEELAAVLDNPLVPDASREAIVQDICERLGASAVAAHTLRLLVRKRRMVAVPEISRQLARLADEDAHVVRAEVVSAGPLTEVYLSKLRAELEQATGKQVLIEHRQDKSLIAGVVTKIGDQVIDGSARARLANFREALLRS